MAALLLIAATVVAGLDWRLVIAAAVAAVSPVLLLVAIVGWAVVAQIARRRSRAQPDAEAAFHTAVATELRGGASLRSAIAAAAAAVPVLDLAGAVRRLTAGVPGGSVAARLETALPVTGRAAAVALELSAASGARAASVFDVLADRATFEAELSREARALTAQARLSALVVGVGPLLFAIVMLASGRGRVLLDHGAAGAIIGAVGLALEVAGLTAVALLIRRGTA